MKAAAALRADMRNTLKLTGDIIGTEVVTVLPRPGQIESILIKEGNRVGRGAVIFKINRMSWVWNTILPSSSPL